MGNSIDPVADALLAEIRKVAKPRTESLSPLEARRTSREAKLKLAGTPLPTAEVHDLVMDRPGAPIPARIYRRRALEKQDCAAPLLVFFHGGGWMIGDLDTHDQLCRRLANETGGTILSVDYRLSPEHKFPAAVEDALFSVAWAHENSAFLGIDSTRLSVGGDSSGGNLAVVASLANRDRKKVRICSQVLLYPVLDMTLKYAQHYELDPAFPLTYPTLAWFKSHYLENGADEMDWRASPMHVETLEGLPPTLIVTARYDPLYPEAAAFVHHLRKSDIDVDHTHFNDQCHGFLNAGHHDPARIEIMRTICQKIRSLWNT
ncbi:MAG: alpha/beta hydrolase [Rhodospirillales bacterium]